MLCQALYVEKLQGLLTAADQEARHAEGRVATLQHRLRAEIMSGTEAALEKGGTLRAAEAGKHYHRQLLLVMDAVERIAYDEGGAVGGGVGVSAVEAEVLHLRRELAATKLQLAEITGERDEARAPRACQPNRPPRRLRVASPTGPPAAA